VVGPRRVCDAATPACAKQTTPAVPQGSMAKDHP